MPHTSLNAHLRQKWKRARCPFEAAQRCLPFTSSLYLAFFCFVLFVFVFFLFVLFMSFPFIYLSCSICSAFLAQVPTQNRTEPTLFTFPIFKDRFENWEVGVSLVSPFIRLCHGLSHQIFPAFFPRRKKGKVEVNFRQTTSGGALNQIASFLSISFLL